MATSTPSTASSSTIPSAKTPPFEKRREERAQEVLAKGRIIDYPSLLAAEPPRMFGKRYRSKTLDLACPTCGHPQQEPARVVSSFCRACGEHFQVRKGVAVAHPGLRVSGIAEIVAPEERRSLFPLAPDSLDPALAPGEAAMENGENPSEAIPPLPAGVVFGLAPAPEDQPEDEPLPAFPLSGIGDQAESRDALSQGSMAALIGAQQTLVLAGREHMPPNFVSPHALRRRDDPLAERSVRCYVCHHVQGVSPYAKSTQCERCCTYISLADYEIKKVSSHTLRTRGDIVITRKGGLVDDSEIVCHHLTVNGAINATVDCSGEAIFRHSGTVRGHLYCEHLVIEKGCEVRFPDGVMTERAEILGRLLGNLTCSGKVLIARNAQLEGELCAIDLELKDGGLITGETRLDPSVHTRLPLRKNFNPAVIG